MLIDKIDGLIATALKSGDKRRWESIKLIKASLLNLQKSEKEYTEAEELNTLIAMKAQIEDSIAQYSKANRKELLEKEYFDLSVLSEFLPKEATENEIILATNSAIEELGRKPTMADMKTVLSKVREKYPTVNGGMVSKILKEKI